MNEMLGRRGRYTRKRRRMEGEEDWKERKKGRGDGRWKGREKGWERRRGKIDQKSIV